MNSFIPVFEPILNGNEKKYLNECIETGWIGANGPFIKKLENDFSEYIGQKYGSCVANGSAAIDVALRAMKDLYKWDDYSEIIIPSFNIISAAQSCIYNKLKPVFVDAEENTWNIDTSKIEEVINKKTKAIIVVHIYGLPSNMNPIMEIANKYNLKVIEDAAQVHGQTYNEKKCGSFGEIATFSFFTNKHIACGEGGIILTSNKDLKEKFDYYKNLCFTSEKFVHSDLGWNYRMSNLQAAVAYAQLENIDKVIKKKQLIGNIYQNLLEELSKCMICKSNQIKIQLTNDNKCIIHTISESPIKSQNTIIKEDISLNDMSLSKSNSIIKNNSHNSSKKIKSDLVNNNATKNIFSDFNSNSNLLISFSNISEVTKLNNNDCSMTRINSNKTNSILINKDKYFSLNLSNNNSNIPSSQMKIKTGDKNVTINNINNYNIANSDGNSVISNNNFFINNDNRKILILNNDNTDSITTPSKVNIYFRNNKSDISSKIKRNNNNSKSINKQLINSFNKNDISEMSIGTINLNIDDKSENYDKVNLVYSDKKSFNQSNNLNSSSSINIASNNNSPSQTIKNSNNKVDNNNIRYFKNCMVQKNENISIIQTNSQNNKNNDDISKEKEINNNNINHINNENLVPNHCANFFFNGIHKEGNNINGFDLNNDSNRSNGNKLNIKNNNLSNNNTEDKNGDAISPTFNLKLNYSTLDKNNNIKTIETIKDKDKENKIDNEIANKSEEKQKNNSDNTKQKEPNSNMPSNLLKLVHEYSNGSTIEANKKILNKNNNINNMNNHKIVNHKNNINNLKNNKQQDKSLSILVNSNLNSKANTNSSKAIKENDIITSNIHKNSSINNINSINSNLNSNKAKMKKNNVLLNNQAKIYIQNKNIIKKDISNYNNNNYNYSYNTHKNGNDNINNQTNLINVCEKCNQIIVCKKNQNSRYKYPNADSIYYNYNNIKNLYTSVNESEGKNKKLSVSHNKSNSGTGSFIKFHAQENYIFNIKSGLKGKKFKSISPTLQHRNFYDVIKGKIKMKGKSQSKSKSKSKNNYKNDFNDINNLFNNGKYNSNTNKQKSLKEKMDIILSKNILALAKKIRKSPSPKLRIVKPSFLRNMINNPKDKLVENLKNNNNFGNNLICNGLIGRKNKNSPSPLSFRISNNNPNYTCNFHTSNNNCNNKKAIVDNLLVVNNKRINSGRKKVIGNSPKYLINKNNSENYDKINDKIYYQSSSSKKSKNFPFKNRAAFGLINNNINAGNRNQKFYNKKIKNISSINKKNMIVTNINEDDYNPIQERKKNNIVLQRNNNKKLLVQKNNNICNINNKNIIKNELSKKNNIMINNIKINSNMYNRQMTVIQNFSKYKKKGALNLNNLTKNCHNENILNNYYEDNKVVNEESSYKKNKNINLNNNISNRTIEDKIKKKEYHSQPKMRNNTNNCYTN